MKRESMKAKFSWDDPLLLAGEERAGAAETGDDLVGNEEDVELAAEIPHGPDPALGRHDDAGLSGRAVNGP